ncbi:glycosyltransferase [Anaerocolumna sedimenticola]|uniref:Glycosyltransferase n=2 Tax=Anaerocolumna sedimenticola TaxID=2696063 RepID=A0A6P1TUF7_9FIRM|nr:glycosyltransferase [Anaerocolumna sedimenticola]
MDRAGIETMLMNYYRHIDRDKIQFDFLCNKTKPGAYDDEIKNMGGKIYRTSGLNPAKYPKYLAYMKNLFAENPEYRIVEAHNGALGVYTLHAAKVNHIPVRIFHAHGASITKDWKLPIKLFCKSRLKANINHNFTCGIAAAECYFGKRVVDDGDYELIPNAIEVEHFVFNADIRKYLREKYKLQNKNVIGHVGRFMTQKNHSFLLEVFKQLSEKDNQAYLVLLGDGELMESMKQKARELDIVEKVLFVGNVGNANEWYQAFDVFVLPSIWEGLPVVGVEAQTADLPCVFSDCVTKEIGFSDKAQFVPLKAPMSGWVEALQSALSMKERSDNSALIREKNYDIKNEAIKLQNRYLKLAEET